MDEKILLTSTDFEFVDGEAFASLGDNDTFRWCKFVLTDDQPNGNKQRVPEDEFDNLIRSGIFTPVKMALGRIETGHKDALPLGVISSLKREGNKILGIAALWASEREDDVNLIKKQFDDGSPVNLSWEIYYDHLEKEEDGTSALRGTTLGAATFVGLPAYKGRTPVLQVASLEGTNLELEQALTKIAELEDKIKDLTKETDESKTALTSITEERDTLLSYKESVEAELAKAEKLAAIKTKFSEAGIEKEADYFDTNSETLLNMKDNELDFMLQELLAFKEKAEATNRGDASLEIPNLVNTDKKTRLDPKEIAKRLRNSN